MNKVYKKSKDYLIAVDSDGCVFDNMTFKHRNFFFPKLLEVFAMTDETGEKAKLWDYFNLLYPHRGSNRFVALYGFFQTYRQRIADQERGDKQLDLSAFKKWLDTTDAIGEKQLQTVVDKSHDPLCTKSFNGPRL